MLKNTKRGAGGGGGGTEEERLLLMQRRVEAEEEATQRREEVLTLFLKEKLQKEERNTAVNLLKLNDGWRAILRRTRAANLRRDITLHGQTFERRLDGLDRFIQNLERDLEEAEQQSARVGRVHLQNVERLLAQQHKQLKVLQQQWESDLQHLTSIFNFERDHMSADSLQKREEEDATFAVQQQQHKAVMDETDTLYNELIMSYQSAHHCWIANLTQTSKEQTVQKQEDEKLCNQETNKLEQLLVTNQQLVHRTDAETKRAKRLQEVVVRLRQKLNADKTAKQSVEEDLTADANRVKLKTRELQEQLSRAQTAARKQLTDLTVQSANSAKKLQAVIGQGEKVLHVAAMCDKLEREQNATLTSFCPEDVPADGTGAETDDPATELQQLMRSINAAVLQREALKKHKGDMSRENRQLRLLLRQRLDAMTVNVDAFRGQRALLAVYPAPTTTIPPHTNKRHEVVEATPAANQSQPE